MSPSAVNMTYDFAHAYICDEADLPDSLKAVYLVSLIVFAAAFVMTGAIILTQDYVPKSTSISGGVVSLVVFMLQLALYATLLMGQGAYYFPELGYCVPWARWATYTISCGILAFEISRASRMGTNYGALFVAMVSITLATGALACLSTKSVDDRWAWFVAGFLPYVAAIITLAMRGHDKNLLYFVLVTWSIYPVVFALGPALGDVASLATESWLYLVGDLITKVGFGIWATTRDADNDGNYPQGFSAVPMTPQAASAAHTTLSIETTVGPPSYNMQTMPRM